MIDYNVVDRSGVFISLSVKIPKGVSNKVRMISTKYSKEIGVIVVNALAHKNKNILYSRDTGSKMLPKQYNPKQITNSSLMKALDILEQNGYIINNIAPRDYGWSEHDSISSSFIATEEMYSFFSTTNNDDQCKHTVLYDTQRVVLKDTKKSAVGYKDCDLTYFSRECLKTYNEYVSKQHITYTNTSEILYKADCSLTRIFNREIGYTGRLYRSEIQNIKGVLRESILINGEETVEIDYSTLHLKMLVDKYLCQSHLEGVRDAYLLPLSKSEQNNESNRAAVKKALNIMLNNSKRYIACSAIQQYLNREGKQCDIRSANVLLERIEQSFSFLPLQLILWQSVPLAYTLQRLDSDIALEIISSGVEDDVVVLPIHDSFIVPLQHKNWLQETMGGVYRKHLKSEDSVPVSVNFKGKIWKEFA